MVARTGLQMVGNWAEQSVYLTVVAMAEKMDDQMAAMMDHSMVAHSDGY
jgi:hypothetical protein